MSGSPTPLFEIQDLHVSADGVEILKGVDLTILPGEVHARSDAASGARV